MTASGLYSHPGKTLETHLEEVAKASKIIAGHHKLAPHVQERLIELVCLHDFGKATKAFQDYILFKPSPHAWLKVRSKRPEDKVHTPLGALASALLQPLEGFGDDWLVQVGCSVMGHHTQLPTRTDVYDSFERYLDVLVKQLQDLPLDALKNLTGFVLDSNAFKSAENTVWAGLDTYQEVFRALDKIETEQAVRNRLTTQLLFSILLEADKAFLALSDEARKRYTERNPQVPDAQLVEQYLAKNAKPSPVNKLRQRARQDALAQLGKYPDAGLYTLTLPTGLGKTLTSASLALELRRSEPRQLIIALPFLSIVDQTAKVYEEVLGTPDTETMMQSHSLSERDYFNLEGNDADFFLDTWQSDTVITTFDQVLLALFSSRSKHQMRFHHLTDAVLIFDEVQALPSHLWDITKRALMGLTNNFGSTVIAMTATQPGFVEDAVELIPNVSDVFKAFGRYRLVLKHRDELPLTQFVEQIQARRDELNERRVLITLNTRRSSRFIYDELTRMGKAGSAPVYFLSADVTPKDRLKVIGELRENYPKPCLVITTQVVEAGVDMDMDLVMRDFAPLDSIIQVAGRCNRNDRRDRCDVEIYSLLNNKGKRYSEQVYKTNSGPDISLQETRRVLEDFDTVDEEDVLELTQRYFEAIRMYKDLGQEHTADWAYFRDHLNVSQLLRGDQDRQYQFVVAERDEPGKSELGLEAALSKALKIEDRWEKRRALRRLAPRMAQVTVNVWEQRGFHPENIAYQVGLSWFVREGFYDSNRGLDIAVGHSDDSHFI